MRFASFERDGTRSIGVVAGGEIVDLSAWSPDVPQDVASFLGLGTQARDLAAQAQGSRAPRYDLSSVRLVAPVPNPGKVFGIGMNYQSFVDALDARPGALPRLWFGRPPACIAGPQDDVWMPRGSMQLDFEGEIALVIGRRCRGVSAGEAPAYIAGYTVCNDFTVRDWAAVSPVLGKSLATHTPMGPWLVTPDELGDPHDLQVTTTVNGVVRQRATSAEMITNVFGLVAELSAVMALEPGDIVLTGTPAGCGVLNRPPQFLGLGDEVRVQVEGIGEIVNTIVAEPLQ